MKTLIIGGGLSGLALADALEAAGHDYLLVEARTRLGGRVLTQQAEGTGFDLGPAWFWPGQPRIAAMIERFGLTKFDQFSQGALSFEDAQGRVQQGKGFASMEGSWRLVGGLGRLIDALAQGLGDHRLRLGMPVTSITMGDKVCTAHFANGDTATADRVVLALPPRIGAQIAFTPALPNSALQAMQETATWMAGQAKAVAVYGTPFWRAQGLSGDATSRRGPMVEIHDASPADGGPYALFGFIGVPPQARTDAEGLRTHVQAQLVRLFGPQAAAPQELIIKDWAFDPHTATQADQAPLYAHPAYGMPADLEGVWGGKLLFAGSEVALTFGGYLEGALEAAEAAFDALTQGPPS